MMQERWGMTGSWIGSVSVWNGDHNLRMCLQIVPERREWTRIAQSARASSISKWRWVFLFTNQSILSLKDLICGAKPTPTEKMPLKGIEQSIFFVRKSQPLFTSFLKAAELVGYVDSPPECTELHPEESSNASASLACTNRKFSRVYLLSGNWNHLNTPIQDWRIQKEPILLDQTHVCLPQVQLARVLLTPSA